MTEYILIMRLLLLEEIWVGFQWCIEFAGIAIVFGAKANDQVLTSIGI